MPYAIQWGMTPYQFWHEDEKLIIVYSKAYNRNAYLQAHIQGAYTFEAISIAFTNILPLIAMNKAKIGDNKYPQKIHDPYAKEKILDKKQVEEKHRQKTNFWASLGS